MNQYKIGILTVSDRSSKGLREDKSGPAIREELAAAGYDSKIAGIVPDEKEQIRDCLIRLADDEKLDLVLTTGGTGMSPRDWTPEATLEAGDRQVPGISEAMRAESMKITPRAMLSRGMSVIRGGTLIINLPGSPKACREYVGFLTPVLEHALSVLKGDVTDCGRH